jgi:adenosylhomocysteine nucleosidase
MTHAELDAVVIVSCRFEWQATLALFPGVELQSSPFGGWFTADRVIFFQGGWGKISAAASAQYVIDRWRPSLIVNLGTCGGFRGEIERGEILLVERTIVYDIVEQMTDPEAAIAQYTTDLDLSWLGAELPQKVRRSLIVSADRDLMADDIPQLKARFGAVAADWESGSIAWVARRNHVRCLILRGVSDLVGGSGGDAYEGNLQVYVDGAAAIMQSLIERLPDWISKARIDA